MAGEQQHDLVNIVRECVRNEIELQRSGREGNANLLARTRDLIASSVKYSFSKTWTGLKSARLVKHGLDSFSKTWTGLKSARLVKHGLKTGNYGWRGERGYSIDI